MPPLPCSIVYFNSSVSPLTFSWTAFPLIQFVLDLYQFVIDKILDFVSPLKTSALCFIQQGAGIKLSTPFLYHYVVGFSVSFWSLTVDFPDVWLLLPFWFCLFLFCFVELLRTFSLCVSYFYHCRNITEQLKERRIYSGLQFKLGRDQRCLFFRVPHEAFLLGLIYWRILSVLLALFFSFLKDSFAGYSILD